MSTDLWMLVATSLLGFVLALVYAVGRSQARGGFNWAVGNRDAPFTAAPWVERAVRAHQNLTENLAPFAVLVLVAHVSGKANAMTACGAMIFFWGRVAHALIYTVGVPYLRTAAWMTAAAGEVLILAQLFR